MSSGPLAKTPFYFLDSCLDREAEVAAYLRREHRRGRPIGAVLADGYVQCRGGHGVLRAVLRRPALIRALGDDVAEAITRDQAALMRPSSDR